MHGTYRSDEHTAFAMLRCGGNIQACCSRPRGGHAVSLPSYAMSQASFPGMYERWLAGPLFRPWAELTLDEVALAAGDSILDIACGTGVVARAARERLGDATRAVGIDLSPDMLAVARILAADIDWRQGAAAALPLRDGERFDVVICQQGLQFFADKPGAVAQMRRAAAPGGRLAVSTWRSDAEVPFFRDLRRIAERHLGAVEDQRYGFGEAGPLQALLRDAGFRDVRVRTAVRTIRLEPDSPFVRLNAMALVGMSAVGRTMDEAGRTRVVETIVGESAPVAQAYREGAGLAFKLRANLATARGA
jgi:ubiquinone/menaquinone biosynthesis C-methylase UbiE